MKVKSSIESKLTKQFNPTSLQVLNESYKHHAPEGSESHFLLVLVSDKFLGVSRVQRQRLIYECLKDELAGDVHALSMKLFSADEWENSSMKEFSTPDCAGARKE